MTIDVARHDTGHGSRTTITVISTCFTISTTLSLSYTPPT